MAVTVDDFTNQTNTKALILNAGEGGGRYKTFSLFSVNEIMAHLAIYLLHSISPSPQIEMKFKTQKEDPVNSSNLCTEVFGSNASIRHEQFKCFFSATDPLKSIPPTNTHPSWKIDPVLKHIMWVSTQCVVLRSNISIDEQDIGFQGQHRGKQHISYKCVGEGFWLMHCVLKDIHRAGTSELP